MPRRRRQTAQRLLDHTTEVIEDGLIRPFPNPSPAYGTLGAKVFGILQHSTRSSYYSSVQNILFLIVIISKARKECDNNTFGINEEHTTDANK